MVQRNLAFLPSDKKWIINTLLHNFINPSFSRTFWSVNFTKNKEYRDMRAAAKAFCGPCQTSKMELFAKIINGWKQSIILDKNLHLRRLSGFPKLFWAAPKSLR